MKNSRNDDRFRLYDLMEALELKIGGERMLSSCSPEMAWPKRGVYFFREPGEVRAESGAGKRIVRIGTHALKKKAKTSLWNRLSNHKGHERTGGGNHRGSIFRLLVGNALIHRDGHKCTTWDSDKPTDVESRMAELSVEQAVTKFIGSMTFLWLDIGDDAGPDSNRGYIERNTISLLSNYCGTVLDLPSGDWLGNYSDRPLVKSSGLWNQKHTKDEYDPLFLDILENLIDQMEASE